LIGSVETNSLMRLYILEIFKPEAQKNMKYLVENK
jgi:hypothetical protein